IKNGLIRTHMTGARAYGKAARRHVTHPPFEHLATAHQEASQRDAAADKLSGKLIPVRFALFVLVRLRTLWITLDRLGFEFAVAQAAATVVGMTSNFVLNTVYLSGSAAARAGFGARSRRLLFDLYSRCGRQRRRCFLCFYFTLYMVARGR